MTEAEPDPIVVRSLTISELMDGDGSRYLSFDDADLDTWDAIGFLESGLIWYRTELSRWWEEAEANDD